MQKQKSTAPAASTIAAKKSSAGTRNKAKEAPAKLPYDMTDAELKSHVDGDVKRQLAPVRPQPKEKIDLKIRQHFVDLLERPSPSVP